MESQEDQRNSKHGSWSRRWRVLRTPSARFSVLTLVAAGLLFGVIGVLGFEYSLHATSTNEFCSSCHANDAAKEWRQSVHYSNRTGVVVGCSDCHLPREFGPKMVRKVKAAKEVWGHFTGVINTPEKFEAHRLEMAESEWARLKANGAQECRNCHHPDLMANKDKPHVRDMHKGVLEGGQICIDCHKGVAHQAPEEKQPAGKKG